MQELRSNIIKLIQVHGQDEEAFLERLRELALSEGDQVFKLALNVFTQLEFTPKEARTIWESILQHRQEMSSRLARSVNLLTVICDYFLTINKAFTYPKVVELRVFEEAHHYSKSDHLTGLYNRGYFEEALHNEISRSKRYGTEFSLLFFDIDDFKRVNDSAGHLAGDMVLKQIAKLIQTEKRAEDIAVRYGGEELVLILPETNKTNSLIKAERIRQKIEDTTISGDGYVFGITVSGGIATFPHDGDTVSQLIDSADKALYQAKAGGKNRIHLFSVEKRQYVRMDFAGPVSVQPLGRWLVDDQLEAISKDLSLSGMLFESTRPMEIGSRVQLGVPIPSSDQPMSLVGTVVRVESLRSGNWDIGTSFVQIQEREQSEIVEYLKKTAHTEPIVA